MGHAHGTSVDIPSTKTTDENQGMNNGLETAKEVIKNPMQLGNWLGSWVTGSGLPESNPNGSGKRDSESNPDGSGKRDSLETYEAQKQRCDQWNKMKEVERKQSKMKEVERKREEMLSSTGTSDGKAYYVGRSADDKVGRSAVAYQKEDLSYQKAKLEDRKKMEEDARLRQEKRGDCFFIDGDKVAHLKVQTIEEIKEQQRIKKKYYAKNFPWPKYRDLWESLAKDGILDLTEEREKEKQEEEKRRRGQEEADEERKRKKRHASVVYTSLEKENAELGMGCESLAEGWLKDMCVTRSICERQENLLWGGM